MAGGLERICKDYGVVDDSGGYLHDGKEAKKIVLKGTCVDSNGDGKTDHVHQTLHYQMPDESWVTISDKLLKWPENSPEQSILTRVVKSSQTKKRAGLATLRASVAKQANGEADRVDLYDHARYFKEAGKWVKKSDGERYHLLHDGKILRVKEFPKDGLVGLEKLKAEAPNLKKTLVYAAEEAGIPDWLLTGMAEVESRFDQGERNYDDCKNPKQDPAKGWSGGMFQIKNCDYMPRWDVIAGRDPDSLKPMRLKYVARLLASWEKVVGDKPGSSPKVDAFDWKGLKKLDRKVQEQKLEALANNVGFRAGPGMSVLADSLEAAYDLAYALEFLGLDMDRFALVKGGRLDKAGLKLKAGDETKFLMIVRAAYNAGVFAVKKEVFVNAFNRLDLAKVKRVSKDRGPKAYHAKAGDLDLAGSHLVLRPDGKPSIMSKYFYDALIFMRFRKASSGEIPQLAVLK